MNELNEIDYAYLAGMLDADGCIQINRKTAYESNNVYALVVSVSQCDNLIPYYLLSKFGGNVFDYTSRNINRKKMARWTIGSFKAKELLEKVLPYLVLKKSRAIVAIKFQETVAKRGFRKSVSGELSVARDSMYSELKELNRSTGRHNYPSHFHYNLKKEE
jgi:hypothetical protein